MSTALATPLSADVTLRSRVQEENGGRTTEVTEYRKGLKTRTDFSEPGMGRVSRILDAGAGRTVMLWHDSKTVTEYDYQMPVPPALRSLPAAPPSITPTSQTREIAGWRCSVYEIRSSSQLSPILVSEPTTIVLEGSTCLVKDGPGQADFVRMHRAAVARARDANPMPTINLRTAELGVPFASEMTVSIGATAPNAQRQKMGRYTMEVTSVSMAPIPIRPSKSPRGTR